MTESEVTEVVEDVVETPEGETAESAVADEGVVEEGVVEEGAVEAAAPREPVYIDRPIQTVGRRKEAVVRVRLVPGTGKFMLDGRSLEAYFPNKVHQQLVNSPLKLVDVEGRFDVIARITGGGVSGQAGALRLGIARALNLIDAEHNRPALKRAGFLSRDARVVERKKAGLKKARKAPQYSKR